MTTFRELGLGSTHGPGDGSGRYRAVAEDVLEDRDPLDIAAAALALAAAKTGRADTRPTEDASEGPPRPARARARVPRDRGGRGPRGRRAPRKRS